MTVFWTLVRRELNGYFFSLTGYVVIATVLFLLGLSFVHLVTALNAEPTEIPITELFYSTMYFWLIILLATPVITMRSFALEKSSGTYENLMTTPVLDWQVVTAKFLGSLVFYMAMWLPLIGCLALVNRYTGDHGSGLHFGVLASTYLGILLLGCLYVSMGCFASSITRSQIIAAMLTFAMGVALFMLSFLSNYMVVKTPWLKRVMTQVSMLEHMQDFVRGILDSRHFIFYISLTALFLFLCCRVVESRRWK